MTVTVEIDPYRLFQARLFDAGVLVATGVDGLYGKSGAFVQIFDGLSRFVSHAGRDGRPEVFRFPPAMPRADLVRTDYISSFPDLIGSIHSFSGDDAAHADLLRTVESASAWVGGLSPTDLVLLPAACYPLYPMASGRLLGGGRTFEVLGTCFRHEPSGDPARMQVFHQQEFVRIADAGTAIEFRNHWLDRSQEMLSSLGLVVRAVVANDPFFGRAGRMLAANQRATTLKYEVVAAVANEAAPTAVVSCNCHQDHLTERFGIFTEDRRSAHSACVGFGLERIVLALFAAHGMNPQRWPATVRHRLSS